MDEINMEFYGSGTVGERGQIVIPAEARNALKIRPGDKFIFAGHGPILHLIKSNEMEKIIDKIHTRFEKAISHVKKLNRKTKS